MVTSLSSNVGRGRGNGGESPLWNGSLSELCKTEELVKERPGIDTKPFLLFFIMAIVWYFLYFVRNGFWRSRA